MVPIRWWSKKGKVIPNWFSTGFTRRVLVSSLDRPFRKGIHYKHNNLFESLEMAQVFHELEHQVDVVNYDSRAEIDYTRYQVVFGSGPPLERVFLQEHICRPRTILYLCGAYPSVNNRASLDRLQVVHRGRDVWLAASARLGDPGVGVERVVDGLIVLGNAVTAEPYRAATSRPVHQLPLLFLQTVDPEEILRARDLSLARNHFLWFAGTGLVHKGLDLVLEAFARHPGLHLHVFGAIDSEPGFVEAYRKELRETPNVHVEGFLALESPAFRAALLASAFVICPSCSEACNSSVLNICGNGGNLPVLTRQNGIDLDDFGILVRDTTVEAVEAALAEAAALTGAELDRRLRRCAAFFQREHSRERFHLRMKEAVQAILDAPGPGGRP
ncbi:MAG: hypothetical protein ABSH53_18165 [Holophaga sp.]